MKFCQFSVDETSNSKTWACFVLLFILCRNQRHTSFSWGMKKRAAFWTSNCDCCIGWKCKAKMRFFFFLADWSANLLFRQFPLLTSINERGKCPDQSKSLLISRLYIWSQRNFILKLLYSLLLFFDLRFHGYSVIYTLHLCTFTAIWVLGSCPFFPCFDCWICILIVWNIVEPFLYTNTWRSLSFVSFLENCLNYLGVSTNFISDLQKFKMNSPIIHLSRRALPSLLRRANVSVSTIVVFGRYIFRVELKISNGQFSLSLSAALEAAWAGELLVSSVSLHITNACEHRHPLRTATGG